MPLRIAAPRLISVLAAGDVQSQSDSDRAAVIQERTSSPEENQASFISPEIEREGDDGRPGATILITRATYAQVRNRVRVDPDVPSCQAKGKAEPIRVCRVLGLSALQGGNGGVT